MPIPRPRYEEYDRAMKTLEHMQTAVGTLRKEIDDYENALRGQMPLSQNEPCKVVKLPDGRYAVHVWKSATAHLHTLYIVELSELSPPEEARREA